MKKNCLLFKHEKNNKTLSNDWPTYCHTGIHVNFVIHVTYSTVVFIQNTDYSDVQQYNIFTIPTICLWYDSHPTTSYRELRSYLRHTE